MNLSSVFDSIHAKLDERAAIGMKTYGRPLVPFNNRDSLKDAQEELLDLLVYLEQHIMEFETLLTVFKDLLDWAEENNCPNEMYIKYKTIYTLLRRE
jgi:hypothetical protein